MDRRCASLSATAASRPCFATRTRHEGGVEPPQPGLSRSTSPLPSLFPFPGGVRLRRALFLPFVTPPSAFDSSTFGGERTLDGLNGSQRRERRGLDRLLLGCLLVNSEGRSE